VTFFDPVGLRYLAVLHPAGAEVELEVDERLYPRADGACFSCDDDRLQRLWAVGARTVDLCSTDAFVDCPGREQRAWLGDAYVQGLVTFVTNPDTRLVARNLMLAARSRRPDGLLAMAAACDVARAGTTIPDFSLHWIRALSSYWLHTGDEELVRRLLPVAEGIVERHEEWRGADGLLEDVPGWVFVEWAQIGRDVVTAAHDALYAVALGDYGRLPGGTAVDSLLARTATGFEALWDATRSAYVDTMGPGGPGRRVSQQTNAAALLAGIVPDHRVTDVIAAIAAPGPATRGGRLVVTTTPADAPTLGAETLWRKPDDFDEEHDVVACQPFFCHVLHAALHRHGRTDLVLDSLLRWYPQVERGTFQEYWSAPPGTSSRCHGWAACPTHDLVAYVLGVRPVAPGFTRAVVDPRLGSLRRAGARVPTPHGWLDVEAADEAISLTVPPGVTVEVGAQEVGEGTHLLDLARPRTALD
jgi:alpha-L-rhamnosidase